MMRQLLNIQLEVEEKYGTTIGSTYLGDKYIMSYPLRTRYLDVGMSVLEDIVVEKLRKIFEESEDY